MPTLTARRRTRTTTDKIKTRSLKAAAETKAETLLLVTTSPTTTTTMATHAINSSFDVVPSTVAVGVGVADGAMPNSNATTTCTFSTHNRQHFQPQPAPPPSNHHHHYYSHLQPQQQQQNYSNLSTSLPPSHHHNSDETGFSSADSVSVAFNGNEAAAAAVAASDVVSTSASAADSAFITAVAASVGTRSVNNGNEVASVPQSNGNSNVMSANFSKVTITTTTPPQTSPSPLQATSATTTQAENKLETSSNAGSTALNGSFKKSSASSHESREDVHSLSGGGSSITTPSRAMLNNSDFSKNNINNSNNNIINNFTKDNPLQNYYNSLSAAGRFDVNDNDDGLGPLPSKWETAYTERGELYFIDHNTGTSHWLDPRLSKFQKKSLEDCSDDELPYGWKKIEDSLYGTYYIDHVNRRTQYENPVLEAKRRAAEQRKQLKSPSLGVESSGRVAETTLATTNDHLRCPPPPPPLILGIGEKTTPPPPPPPSLLMLPYKFTRDPAEMQGERITTTLMKSARGLGITIVGGDDAIEEFLQIKSVVPNGPAWLDGRLQMGDVLVYVNDICVLGFTHHEMVNVFQSILPGETVVLEVCRGYPLPFDPNDPNTEVVTTIAVDGITAEPEKQRRLLLDLNMDGNYNFLDVSDGGGGVGGNFTDVSLKNTKGHASESPGDFILMKKPEVLTFSIVKGAMGFGFTIADSAYGQKVKKILDRNCCKQLQEGDILLEINSLSVRNKTHMDVVQVLKDCSKTSPTTVKIQRSGSNFNGSTNSGGLSNVAKLRKNLIGSHSNSGLFRSKTPTADLYSTQQKEILPIRPKTPLVDTRARAQTPNNELNDAEVAAATNGIDSHSADVLDHRSLAISAADNKSPQQDAKSTNSLQELDVMQQEIPFMDPYPKLVTSLSERLAGATLLNDTLGATHRSHANAAANTNHYDSQEYIPASCSYSGGGAGGVGGYNPIYGMSPMLSANLTSLHPPVQHAVHSLSNSGPLYTPSTMHLMTGSTTPAPTYHHESCYCYECQDYQRNKYRQQQQHQQLQQIQANYYTLQHPQQQQQSLNHHHQQQALYSPVLHSTAASTTTTPLQAAHIQNERMQKRVNELLSDRRKVGFNPLEAHHSVGHSAGYHQQQQQSPPALSLPQQHLHTNWNYSNMLHPVMVGGGMPQTGSNLLTNGGTLTPILRHNLDEDEHQQYELTEVTLERQALGFGFRIVGGTEEGSQVTVGHIVPGGAADNDHRIATGDEILRIDGINVVNSSHHKVVSLMGEAALRGQVNMILRRRTIRHLAPMPAALRHPANNVRYPYDVIVSRHENEGFGFVIISSSNQYYGSTIGKLIPGSPADRCGELKVGDRIIAVNRIEIAGMSHGDVVQLIKESGLHVRLTIGCPKEGNPLSTSAQASPASSQLSQNQQSPSSASTTAEASASAAAASTSSASLLQHQQNQQHPLPQIETPNYFERNSQITQHPQL